MSALNAVWEWVRIHWGLQPDPNIKSWIEFATIAIGLATAVIGLASALVVLVTKLFALWRQRRRHRVMEETQREGSRRFEEWQKARDRDQARITTELERFNALVTNLEQRNDRTSDRALKLIREGNWVQARELLQTILVETAKNEKEGAKAARNLALLTEDKMEAAELYVRAATLDRENTEDWIDAGDLYVESGNLEKALNAYKQGFDRLERNQDQEGTKDVRKKLGDVFDKIGDKLEVDGKLSEALEFYEKSRDERFSLKSWQQDLAETYEKIGRARFKLSNLDEVLKAHREFAIANRLAEQHQDNENWVRDRMISRARFLKSVRVHGNQDKTVSAFESALNIREGLNKVSTDTSVRLRLSRLQETLGDILVVQEKWEPAKKHYDAALEARGGLDGNVAMQLDLAMLYDKIGDVLFRQEEWKPAVARYTEALAIRQKLAENGAMQLDLSMLYERIGDEQALAKGLREAADSYSKAYKIVDENAKANPTNDGLKRNLSDLYEKFGDAVYEDDDTRLNEVLNAYQESFRIRSELPDGKNDDDRLLALAKSHERLGVANQKRADKENQERAITEWYAALDIYERLRKAAGDDTLEQVFLQVFLFEPLRQLGNLETGTAGRAKLKLAVAFLRAHDHQFKPHAKTWIDNIDREIAKTP